MNAGLTGVGRGATPGAVLIVCLAAFLLAWSLASVRIGVPAFDGRHAVLMLATGWLVAACGLVAWRRAPASRVGPLLVLTATAWFVRDFRWLEFAPAADAAVALALVYAAIAGHAVLTAPTGHADRWTLRAIVGAGYLAALAPVPRADLLVAAVLLAGIGLVAWRERTPTPERRLALAAGAAFAIVLGVSWRLPALAAWPGWLDARPLLQLTLVSLALALVVPLIRAQARASHVADVVVEVGANRRMDLVRELGLLLGDPTLRLGFWHMPQGRYVDAQGRPVDLPAEGSDEVATLVEEEGAPLAVLVHATDAHLDPSLRAAVRHAARIAAENAQLQAEVRGQVVDLRASRRRLLAARDGERLEIERRLAEGLGPRLGALRGALEDPLLREEPIVAGVIDQIDQTHRDVDRLSHGIVPLLDDLGLEGALVELAGRAPVPVDLDIAATAVPSHTSRTAILFVVGEALANVAKHALPCHVRVRLSGDDRNVRVEVTDDGRGGAVPSDGNGLQGLRDRIEALGGRLTIESPAGSGTRLTATLPLEDQTW